MIVMMSGGSGFLDSVPRSDTLFGAICWALRWLEGEPALLDLLARVGTRDPPFLISSAFPYGEVAGHRTFFLPRPLLPLFGEGGAREMPVSPKTLRRIRWVSASVFHEMLVGRMRPVELASGLAGGTLEARSGAIARAGEAIPDPGEADVERNGINRLSGVVDEGILFTSRVQAIRGGGYYCLVRPRHAGIEERIAASFRLLAERGIGGDSSVGRGYFQVSFEAGEPISGPPDGDALITLSLFHPSHEDLQHLAANRDRLRYSVEIRRGRLEQMYAPHRRVWKPILLCLAEGSVFPPAGDREVYGQAPVVLEEPFRVRQNGFAFPVRFHHAISL